MFLKIVSSAEMLMNLCIITMLLITPCTMLPLLLHLQRSSNCSSSRPRCKSSTRVLTQATVGQLLTSVIMLAVAYIFCQHCEHVCIVISQHRNLLGI